MEPETALYEPNPLSGKLPIKMARVVLVSGEAIGTVFEFEDQATIGRSSSNEIAISGTQISRNHARIFWQNDVHLIEDTGSRNGVLVNDVKIDCATALNKGDEIRIGDNRLVYEPTFEILLGSQSSVSTHPVFVTEHGHAHEGLVTKDAQDVLGLLLPEDSSIHSSQNEIESPQLKILRSRLHGLYEVGKMMAENLDLEDLLQSIAQLIVELLDADRCVVLIPDAKDNPHPVALAFHEEGLPEPRDANSSEDVSISSTILQMAYTDRKAVLSVDVRHDSRFDSSQSIKFSEIRSLLCAPLIARDEVLGVLYLDVLEARTSFADEDLDLLVTLASQAASAIQCARTARSTRAEVGLLRERISREHQFVGNSPQMNDVSSQLLKVATSDVTVLLRGETGTGKEIAARMIHEHSNRHGKPFVAVNCAAMTETLLESELFGHEKGAFTGAHKTKPGKFEIADGGTLFLDEIGEIDSPTQTKLLRVLQEKCFHRVGGVHLIKVDVRIVAATNADLELEMKEGRFREDLFYRLSVVPVSLPPLRDREGDVEILAQHFLEQFAQSIGKDVRRFSSDAMAILLSYSWPGNVRELRNLIERLVVLSDGEEIQTEDLPANMRGEDLAHGIRNSLTGENLALPDIIRRTERICISQAIKKSGGKKVEAARMLQISRPTLDKKIKEYQIPMP
ncbi:MAG: sigma 54-interacting transcriptional regulator [Planctomycetota bacterium]|jgi:Nif-specific regulatory protein|nr:sigma 54-interacting transcriptional regulator [Planctomycetota bacterium]